MIFDQRMKFIKYAKSNKVEDFSFKKIYGIMKIQILQK